MEAFIERLIDEEKELDTKIIKLTHFLATDKFYELSGELQTLMVLQLSTMEDYKIILNRRIELLS